MGLAPAAQAAPALVPQPLVTVSPSALKLTGTAGQTLRGTFTITNPTGCGARLSISNVTSRIDLDYPRSALGANETMTVEATAVFREAGFDQRRVVITTRVAEDCKARALALLNDRKHDALEPQERQLAELRAQAGEADAKDRERALAAQHDARLETLAQQEKATIEAAEAELAALKQVGAEAARAQAERITKQTLKLQLMRTDDTAMKALDAEIAKAREQARKEIDQAHAAAGAKCGSVGDLVREKERALDELRAGAWHSECNRTASQIFKEEGETIEQHLRRAKGRMIPAPPEAIEKKAAEYDQQITAVKQECAALKAREQEVTKAGIAGVRDLEAKRPEVQKAQQATLLRAQQELELLINNDRESKVRQLQRVRAAEQKHEAALEAVRAQKRQALAEKQRALESSRKERDRGTAELHRRIADLEQRADRLRGELRTTELEIMNAGLSSHRSEILIDATATAATP